MNERKIWIRGLTPSDKGKRITIDGQDYLLRDAQHFSDRTVISVVTSLEFDHRTDVEVHDG